MIESDLSLRTDFFHSTLSYICSALEKKDGVFQLRPLDRLPQIEMERKIRLLAAKTIDIQRYGTFYGKGDTLIQVREGGVVRDIADPVDKVTYDYSDTSGHMYFGPSFPGGLWGIVQILAQSRLARGDAWGRPSFFSDVISHLPRYWWDNTPGYFRRFIATHVHRGTFPLQLADTNSNDYLLGIGDIHGMRQRFNHYYKDNLLLHPTLSALPLEHYLIGPGNRDTYHSGSYFFGYPRFDVDGLPLVKNSSLLSLYPKIIRHVLMKKLVEFNGTYVPFGELPLYPYVRYSDVAQLPHEWSHSGVGEIVVNFVEQSTLPPIFDGERRLVIDAWFGKQICNDFGVSYTKAYLPLLEHRLGEIGSVEAKKGRPMALRRILVNR